MSCVGCTAYRTPETGECDACPLGGGWPPGRPDPERGTYEPQLPQTPLGELGVVALVALGLLALGLAPLAIAGWHP